MPVLQRSRGIGTCKPHGGQTQGSLLRALGGGVKCPGERQPFVLPTRLDVAQRCDSDYIMSDVPTLNGGVAIDRMCIGYVTFPPAAGASGLTGGGFWPKVSRGWQLACEKAPYSRPRRPSPNLLPCSRWSF